MEQGEGQDGGEGRRVMEPNHVGSRGELCLPQKRRLRVTEEK